MSKVSGRRLLLFALAVLFLALQVLAVPKIFAANNSAWVNEPLFMSILRELPSNASIITQPDLATCQNQTYSVKPKIFIPPNTTVQAEQKQDVCATKTQFGSMGGNYALLNHTGAAGKVVNTAGQFAYQPLLNSPDLLSSHSVLPSGAYMDFTRDAAKSFLPSQHPATKELTYTVGKQPDITIKDKAGNSLRGVLSSRWTTSNAQWMSVEGAGLYYRVNLKTFEVTPFAKGYEYGIGRGPLAGSAISEDGRYAAAYSPTKSRFELYDISTCGPIPDTINQQASCQKRDMWQYLQQQTSFGAILAVNGVRFIGPNSVSFYASFRQTDGSQKKYKLLLKNSAETEGISYLALGDSFSSGEGSFDYEGFSNSSDNKCHTSKLSYPYILASDLGLDDSRSVACSGAIMSDIAPYSDTYVGQVKNKLSYGLRTNKTEIETYLLPGYQPQIKFVSVHKPQNVTISIGGNDAGFSDILLNCILLEPTCYATYERRIELTRFINSKFASLTDTYRQLKSSAALDAHIYVVGYPYFADPNGNCATNVQLNQTELVFSKQLVDYLNGVIEQATKKAGVSYIDISNSLRGGELCSGSTRANTTVHGLTLGTDMYNLISAASFHPTAHGQDLMHFYVKRLTSDFDLENPEPDDSIQQPADPDETHPMLSVPKSDLKTRNIIYASELSEDVVFKDSGTTIRFGDVILQKNSDFDVYIHSEPVYAGSLTSDDDGVLEGSITVPEQIAPGFHTLHLYGKNIASEDVDIQKLVYVAASPNDADGDGLNDDQDDCPLFAPSVDTDQDGIDDLCDDEFNEPEIVVVVVEEAPHEEQETNQNTEDPKQILENQPSLSSPATENEATPIPSTVTSVSQPQNRRNTIQTPEESVAPIASIESTQQVAGAATIAQIPDAESIEIKEQSESSYVQTSILVTATLTGLVGGFVIYKKYKKSSNLP